MEISNSEKIIILLNRLDFHTNEIQRREETETKLFEWSTALLLAVFVAVIALAGSSNSLSYPVITKAIASILIGVPTCIFAYRMLDERKSQARQAEVIDKIDSEFKFFEEGIYITDDALYPERWKNNLTKLMLRRKTPVIYSTITILMTVLVISAIWLV